MKLNYTINILKFYVQITDKNNIQIQSNDKNIWLTNESSI